MKREKENFFLVPNQIFMTKGEEEREKEIWWLEEEKNGMKKNSTTLFLAFDEKSADGVSEQKGMFYVHKEKGGRGRLDKDPCRREPRSKL